MALLGKGYFIWRLANTEGGNATTIANLAQQCEYTHLLIKIADGANSYNIVNNVDLVPPLVNALHARGIQAWGWHYIYGDFPLDEANKAIQRIQATGVDGYVMDVEVEYKEPGKAAAADIFLDRLRSVLPNIPVAFCSYRYPTLHPEIPYTVFLERSNYNMPQVYWEANHNPADQLARSVSEYQAITPFRPIVPVGSAYLTSTWAATAADVIAFMNAARNLNLSAANFWEWAHTRQNLPAVWSAICDYDWPTTPPPPDIVQQYITALNTRNPDQVTALYTPSGVHVTAARTIFGTAALRSWYQTFFNTLLPNAVFTLASFSGSGSSRTFNWTATSSAGRVNNGRDTFGLVGGKISYHYTSFSVTRA
jgi:hypothetical protein